MGDQTSLAHEMRTNAIDLTVDALQASQSPTSLQHEGAPSPGWPDLRPLPPIAQSAPSLPLEMMPVPLRNWLANATRRLGVPVEFLAVPLIVALGSILGRNITIRPKALAPWTVVAALWGMLVGRPSSMKSPSLSEPLHFLRRLARESDETWQRDAARNRAKVAVLEEKRRGLLRKTAKDALVDPRIDEVTKVERELEQARLNSRRRRFIVNDCTVEALQTILEENPRGVLHFRDELSGFIANMSREGHEGDRAFFIEAADGGVGGSYETDRIGRGNTRNAGPCVGVLGGIQPGKLSRIVAGAISQGADDDGFVQRFRLLVWPDDPGAELGEDVPSDLEAEDRVLRVFRVLDTPPPGKLGAVEEGGGLPYLRFGPKAQELFDDWLRDHHARSRLDDLVSAPAFEAHLTKYRSLVPALALIFHLVDVADGTVTPGPVTEVAVDLAIQWADFLELHARKVYGHELRPDTEAAHALARKIRSGQLLDGMSVNDIAERDWSGLGRPGLVHAGLDLLERHGWVRRVPIPTSGRTKTVVHLHPDLRAKENL